MHWSVLKYYKIVLRNANLLVEHTASRTTRIIIFLVIPFFTIIISFLQLE